MTNETSKAAWLSRPPAFQWYVMGSSTRSCVPVVQPGAERYKSLVLSSRPERSQWLFTRTAGIHRLSRGCARLVGDSDVSCERFLKRLSLTHLSQCPNHGFFSLGQLNDQAVLTPEPTVVVRSQSPNIFDDGGARAG